MSKVLVTWWTSSVPLFLAAGPTPRNSSLMTSTQTTTTTNLHLGKEKCHSYCFIWKFSCDFMISSYVFCSVDIVPICKDSVVCLPKKLAHQLGGIGQICVVQRITNNISVIDPSTAQCKLHVILCVCWVGPFMPSCFAVCVCLCVYLVI